MESNFSNRIQDVIRMSREEALRLGKDYIGTEHLMLGVIKAGQGVAIRILQNLNVDLFLLKKNLEESTEPGASITQAGNIPLTKQAEKVLKITYLEAKITKSAIIGTEHLLLSILKEEDNVAAQVLEKIGITYDIARDAFDEIIVNQIKTENKQTKKSSHPITTTEEQKIDIWIDTAVRL
ncbi:hypothetical protein EST62_08980 [Chlorobaculum sp. 24CR]|nr:Clp protease N-terminal domain-containing protein [Chlorobaculum sp. 24CR]RXK84722.1 hypothetical protein EST62_08980 [Chlorobaculum sp. 24CR]